MSLRLLLQTTIPTTADDWSISRFSLLHQHLASLTDASGQALCEVVARDRDAGPDDSVLSNLAASDFDQLWLMGVDVGNGLSAADVAGIQGFYERGGGVMATRDHQDLGCSLCAVDTIGALHYFHSRNPDPDPERQACDDTFTTTITWPNYHSGRNGDFQTIQPATEPVHPLLVGSAGEAIRYFPAHPHEGAVGANIPDSTVIATGLSQTTQRTFNLAVACDREGQGRIVAESTFHHFVDYNWDTRLGCPSFVEEAPGKGYLEKPEALEDIKAYVANIARWLARQI